MCVRVWVIQIGNILYNFLLGRVVQYMNCGGTLITEKYVVSAAHCVEYYEA